MLRGSLKSSASGEEGMVQYVEQLLERCCSREWKSGEGESVVIVDYEKVRK